MISKHGITFYDKYILQSPGENPGPLFHNQMLHLHTCNALALFSRLFLNQVHFTPSIGSMWVLIEAGSDFISYFPDVCSVALRSVSPSAIYEYTLL